MPELPEVEITARRLDGALRGAEIESALAPGINALRSFDPPLTERGSRQAERVAVALSGEVFDEIVISPLHRPRLTAAPLLAERGADEVIEPWLEEIREPNWHGTPAELARKAYEVNKGHQRRYL